MIAGPLAADADVFALCLAAGDRHFDQFEHGGVAFVEFGEQAGIPIHAQGELSQVIRADGEAISHLQKRIRQQGVGGDFAHDVELQAVFAALEAMLCHQLNHGLGFAHRAHKG